MTMKWLDFKPEIGRHIEAGRNKHGAYVFEIPDEPHALSTSLALKLKRCGFILLRDRWVAPISWQSAYKILWELRDDLIQARRMGKILNCYRYIPEATEDTEIWRVDLRPFGYNSEFNGGKEKLISLLVKLMETAGIGENITGLTCGGVPVCIERGETPIRNRRQTFWKVGEGENVVSFDKPDHVEHFLGNRSIEFVFEILGLIQKRGQF
jgi:hypothetical protein